MAFADESNRQAEAELQIARLSHAYAAAADARDGSALAELFSPGGRLEVVRGDDESESYEGRPGLESALDALRPFDLVQHAVLSQGFEVAEDSATGDVAMSAHHVRRLDPDVGIDTVLHGRYRDRYERDQEGRWRFAVRRLEVAFRETREVSGPGRRSGAGERITILRELADRRAIEDLVLRYCRAVDRLDREGIRACYHADGTDRHTGFYGVADEYVEWVLGMLTRLDGTMHLIGNHHSEVEGDLARAETYGLAFHWGTPRADRALNFVSAFRYVDRLSRRDGEWRLQERVAVREWTRALRDEDWMAPEGEAPTASRDGADFVYAAGFRRLDRDR